MEKINGELELAKKKRQALDKLFEEGRVSQPTYDSFSNEVAEAIAEIETKQNILVEKMKTKIGELEQQMKTLEHLLVNSEIRHISGEIEEEAYNRECDVLSLGLETTGHELNEIKKAISDLNEKDIGLPPPPLQVEEEAEAVSEPETEERLEIVMDTETTESIETSVEEQSTVEDETGVLGETGPEPEAGLEPIVEETESFRQDEPPLSEEAETSETSEDTQEVQTEVSEEVPVEEETTQAEE